jgi:hypothetical protein
MKPQRLLSWTLILSLLGGGWFATEEWLAAETRLRERDLAISTLSEARMLFARHPELFQGSGGFFGSEVALKALLQESSTQHGLQLGFLSEADKEAGKGKRERQVSARLVRAPHGSLIPFLADLEARGAGAVIKELHLRPSKDVSGTYEDAEVVFSRMTLTGTVPSSPPSTQKEGKP